MGEEKNEVGFRYRRRWDEAQRGQKFKSRCVAVWEGGLGIATRKSQMLRTQEVPRTQQGVH